MECDSRDRLRRFSTIKITRCAKNPTTKNWAWTTTVALGVVLLSQLGCGVLSEPLIMESETLRLVFVLFRHGARNPIYEKNYDLFSNHQWPGGYGALTNLGKNQMYELGMKYRSYYSEFLNDEYCGDEVLIRSSDVPRCLMSAYTFLAGLYPPTARQMWRPELPWQPIPVHTLPTYLDNTVAATKICKVWKAMRDEQHAEKNVDPMFTDMFDHVSKHMNVSIRSVSNIGYLYSHMLIGQENGQKLPEWTKKYFPDKMRSALGLALALASYNETLQRLKVGPLLGDINKYFKDYTTRVNVERSLYLYSAHDMNLVALWRALGFEELLVPDYGASVILELYEKVKEEQNETIYFVKALYWNDTRIEAPLHLKLPFCRNPCPYDQFIQHIEKLIPGDWEAECKNTAD